MKRMKFAIALLVFAGVFSIGCKSSSEKNKIIGKWTVDKAFAERTKYDLPMQADYIDSTLNKKFGGNVYDFMEGGKLTITDANGQIQGTWEMLKDEKNGNKELSAIKMKGEGWEELWVPGSGESLFYMKDIDNALYAKLVISRDGTSFFYNLSKNK
ncbi:MAG: hypothetical protein IPI66_11535 [Chitinophagaceae bacterium]|nr:hypothetical protein [Chitinophagaceae bacterium]